jgi:uncharacterized membrane protein YkvA (DUF1232 family)
MFAIVASVVLLFLELELSLDHPMFVTVERIGFWLTGFFVIELSLRWYAAPTTRRFWREYWLDVIAVIPFFRTMRILRVLRMLRILRMYRFGVIAQHFVTRKGEYDFERKIRDDIAHYRGRYAEQVCLAPDLFRMFGNLLDDGRVHAEARNKIVVAIAYFITPFELMPRDSYGPEGYLDQVYFCLRTVADLRQELPDWLLEDAWEGEGSVIGILDELPEIKEHLEPQAEEVLARYLGLTRPQFSVAAS